MVRKKVEGDEEQRRAAAHEAHRAGETPSARRATTGASKQRAHVPGRHAVGHEERMDALHRGKQQHRAEQTRQAPQEPETEPRFDKRHRAEYSPEHEEVFRAVAQAQEEHDGAAVRLDEIAALSSLSAERIRTLLHDLVSVHRLVAEVQGADTPDLGSRFEAKPRR